LISSSPIVLIGLLPFLEIYNYLTMGHFFIQITGGIDWLNIEKKYTRVSQFPLALESLGVMVFVAGLGL
jgi:hypothetical protein